MSGFDGGVGARGASGAAALPSVRTRWVWPLQVAWKSIVPRWALKASGVESQAPAQRSRRMRVPAPVPSLVHGSAPWARSLAANTTRVPIGTSGEPGSSAGQPPGHPVTGAGAVVAAGPRAEPWIDQRRGPETSVATKKRRSPATAIWFSWSPSRLVTPWKAVSRRVPARVPSLRHRLSPEPPGGIPTHAMPPGTGFRKSVNAGPRLGRASVTRNRVPPGVPSLVHRSADSSSPPVRKKAREPETVRLWA